MSSTTASNAATVGAAAVAGACVGFALRPSIVSLWSKLQGPAPALFTSPGGASLAQLEGDGAECLSLLARHFAGLSKGSVPCTTPGRQPGDVARELPESPPQEPTATTELLATVENVIFPGLTHWQHPRFMAYYPACTSLPAVLSEVLIAGAGVVGLQVRACVCVRVEVVRVVVVRVVVW